MNSEFSFSKAEEPSLPYYLSIAGGKIIGFIPFPRLLVLCEMQSASSRIWTRVAMSISNDDNHYTTGTSQLCQQIIKTGNMSLSFGKGLQIWTRRKVNLATIEGNQKAPFSIASTPRCKGGCYSFLGLLHFTLDTVFIFLSIKQGGIKYHFSSLWYDAFWEWTQVSWTIDEHSIH